jgi:hypothetical protein
MSGPSPSGTTRRTLSSNSRLSGRSRASSRHQYVTPQENNTTPVLEVEACPRRSRAPRSVEPQPNHSSRRRSCVLGRTGRQVDPDQGVVRIPRAQIGGGIRIQREDVPVRSSVTLLTARMSLRSAGPGLVPTLSVLASCHSREPFGEEQTLRRPARIVDRGSRRPLSKLNLESGPRALVAILAFWSCATAP